MVWQPPWSVYTYDRPCCLPLTLYFQQWCCYGCQQSPPTCNGRLPLCPHPLPPRAGLTLHLDSLRIHRPAQLATGATYTGNVLVSESAKIGSGCLIGPDVSIADGCVIGDGVRLSNCVIMRCVSLDAILTCTCCLPASSTLLHVFTACSQRGAMRLLAGVCCSAGALAAPSSRAPAPLRCRVTCHTSAIGRGVHIKDHSKVHNCIVGWESKVGSWARLENHCVLGEDVTVKVGAMWGCSFMPTGCYRCPACSRAPAGAPWFSSQRGWRFSGACGCRGLLQAGAWQIGA